jgi:hypothetical protein
MCPWLTTGVERHSLCRCRVADHGDELWITPGAELPIGAVTVTTLWAACRTDFPGIRWQADPAPQARSAEERKRRGSTARPPVRGPHGCSAVGGTLTSARPQCRRRRPRRGHRRWRRLLHREWRSTTTGGTCGNDTGRTPVDRASLDRSFVILAGLIKVLTSDNESTTSSNFCLHARCRLGSRASPQDQEVTSAAPEETSFCLQTVY